VLLVVFGAGASFDSVHDLPPTRILAALRPTLPDQHFYENDRPPLANQLFDNRREFVSAMARFPDCLPLIPMLRKSGVIVERELARIQAQADDYPQVHKELASIRYYLHVALWECQLRWETRHSGITNYATFLREIDRWRLAFHEKVCFVTFNYDTMLDKQLEQLLKVRFEVMKDYAQQNYSLIKLHGSINWGREVIDFSGHRRHNLHDLIDAASEPRFSDRYRIVEGCPMYQMPKDGALVFPALSIPVVNKDEFSCPRDHVAFLETALTKVTKMITVGWRATEAEFLRLLHTKVRANNPQLMIVSDSAENARETYNNLTGHFATAIADPFGQLPDTGLSPGPRKTVTGGFTGMTNSLDQLDAFLRS
jgi:hypothetical protein